MRFYLNCIILFFFFISSCKKDLLHWQKVQQLNSNTNCTLCHIRYLNDSVCIIAGGFQYSQAEVLRSTDGGYTWNSNSYPQAGLCMYGMCVAPDGTIYLSATYGRTLYSKDNGLTWQTGRIYDYLYYVGVSFPTPDTGVLVSTVLQRQGTITEVDTNFNIISEITYQFGLNDVKMVSPSTGYVMGYGAVLKTTDYRHTWNFQNVQGDNFMSMDIHGDEIWMCGYNGSIYHTLDGGNNWQRLRNGNDITLVRYNLMCIVFKDELNGWASCDNGKIIHTDDGGNHWEEYDQFTTNSLRSIVLCPNGDLLTAGDNGALYRITP